MAVAHIAFNDQLPHGRLLRRSLQMIEEGKEALGDLLDSVTTMVDGDGSQAAHFAYLVGKFGFADAASAKAAYDELVLVYGKLNTNAATTGTLTAMRTAFAKFR